MGGRPAHAPESLSAHAATGGLLRALAGGLARVPAGGPPGAATDASATGPADGAVAGSAIGLIGKLPAHGDFVRRGGPRAGLARLDGWLDAELSDAAAGGITADEAVAALDGARVAWGGAESHVVAVLAASGDRVGRVFPVLAARTGAPLSHAAAEGWCAAAHATLAAARDAGADADAAYAALAALPDPADDAGESAGDTGAEAPDVPQRSVADDRIAPEDGAMDAPPVGDALTDVATTGAAMIAGADPAIVDAPPPAACADGAADDAAGGGALAHDGADVPSDVCAADASRPTDDDGSVASPAAHDDDGRSDAVSPPRAALSAAGDASPAGAWDAAPAAGWWRDGDAAATGDGLPTGDAFRALLEDAR